MLAKFMSKGSIALINTLDWRGLENLTFRVACSFVQENIDWLITQFFKLIGY